MAKKKQTYFSKDDRTALQAIEAAQYIAFAPMVFQAARSLRNLGLLQIVESAGEKGISLNEVVKRSQLSVYGVRVLLEAGLGIGLLIVNKGKYQLTKTGYYILSDAMTKVNMDFVHDVCYKGMFDLEASIRTGLPEGLKTFGSWSTVYEALQYLPEQVRKCWFAFDHYYSDNSFRIVSPHVFKNKPARILDIGGNTGKWAINCLSYSPTVQMGIVDLPGQLKMAKENLEKRSLSDRVSFYETNILDPKANLPAGYDVIWMSQFLDCFSEEQIISILKKCHAVLNKGGNVFILEPLWDKQKYETSAFCLQMTSLYFTNMANGNSQMYSSELFTQLVEKSGFVVEKQIDNIGISHTLLRCKKK